MSFDLTPPSGSPIADLSYRNFEGPLKPRALRWWIVALATLRPAIKKPGFWVLVALSVLPYLLTGFFLYLRSQAGIPSMGENPDSKYAVALWNALSTQGLFLFLMALTVGSGCIAADNQANALLVYLSKPITKGDYLLGKWMGVFLVLFGLAFVPGFCLYSFCLFSYTSDGFLRDDPVLLMRLLGASLVPAVLHASLIVGFSAWSKTARMAGAFYAGVYFITLTIAAALSPHTLDGDTLTTTQQLTRHLSVDGIIKGVSQGIYRITHGPMGINLGTPPLAPLLLIAIVVCAAGIAAARTKVRAVEVIGG